MQRDGNNEAHTLLYTLLFLKLPDLEASRMRNLLRVFENTAWLVDRVPRKRMHCQYKYLAAPFVTIA